MGSDRVNGVGVQGACRGGGRGALTGDWFRKWNLLIKKGKGSIVLTTPAIAPDAIKIRRIRLATSVPKLPLPPLLLWRQGQVENVRAHLRGSIFTQLFSDQEG